MSVCLFVTKTISKSKLRIFLLRKTCNKEIMMAELILSQDDHNSVEEILIKIVIIFYEKLSNKHRRNFK
jgi:hypothetical protein